MSDTSRMQRPSSLDTVQERPGGRSARVREQVLDATRAELLQSGYGALSHRTVARRAGVDPATVYRRWPSRPHLATDALLEIASEAVPVPDTGNLSSDLRIHLQAIVEVLADTKTLRLFHAMSAVRAESEDDLLETLRAFWDTRFAASEEMVTRAIARGEASAEADPHSVIEQLVSPAYFRALVTGEALDADFTERCVERALAGANAAFPDPRR